MAIATASEFVSDQVAPINDPGSTALAIALTSGADFLAEVADDETFGGHGILLDADRCPVWALPWLGQFVGVSNIAALSEAAQRATIKDQPQTKRGTVAYLISKVQATLTGTQSVFVVERYNGDAWQLFVATLTSETASPTNTAAAAQANVPAGIIVTASVVTGQTFAQLKTNYASFTLATAGFANFTAMQAG